VTPASVRVAAAQYPIERFASRGAIADKLARWVADAARQGAQLVVFPEYGAMEYAGPAGAGAETLHGCLSATADAMTHFGGVHADLARRHGLFILAASGPQRQAAGTFVNAARLYGPSGASVTQAKMMMTPFEQRWGIQPGRELVVAETPLGGIGIAVCYDSEFPLLVRALAVAEADLVLVPSCTEFVSGFHRVRTAALARALENGIATVQSPTVGLAPWSPAVDVNAGAAGIYVPSERGLSDTGVLVAGTMNQPDLVVGDIDLAHLRHVREAGEMRNRQDWALQPGVGGTEVPVRRVTLS
jgi:predicted amidohydrolase